MKKPTTLVICAHPDDGDIFCGELCAQSINAGWNVHELLMTTDEYGTTRNDFKGTRIKAIRKKEMIRAAHRYGVDINGNSKLNLHWANYVDGFAPCNKNSILRLRKFILKIKPDIIIGPDPFVSFDVHKDHVATGKNYYYALKWILPEDRPKIMLFYHSLMPNFFLPSLNPNQLFNVRRSHKSQWTERDVKFNGNIQKFLYTTRWIRFTGGRNGDGYRKVTFDNSDHFPKGIAKITSYFLQHKGYNENHFVPSPQELNLNIHPEGEIV